MKELKELVKIGKQTNRTLEKSNKMIFWTIILCAFTVLVNIATIIAIVWVVLK